MNFYQKHIGDFNNATRHLTRVERSLYSDAIELYYDTEKPLAKDFDRLCRLLLAHSEEEKTALKAVLDEFFTLTDEGYFNKRCHEEIVKYQGFKESRSKAGKASAEQRASKKATDVEHVLNTEATNHKPITNNQYKNHSCADAHFDEFWKAYPNVRKVAKKNCLAKWKAKKLDLIAEKILSDVRAKSGPWGEFAPSPLTYINQERWNDDLPQSSTPRKYL